MARWVRPVCFSVTLVLLLTRPMPPVWAFIPVSGSNVVVSEAVHDDLYAAGGTLTVTVPIDGDIVVASGTADLTGDVTGGVLAAGGTVRISGPVARSVRAAAGTLTLASRVGGDAVLAGGTVVLDSTAQIGRDLVIGGGNATVSGNVERNARIGAGDVTIAGSIGGDTAIEASHVVLLPTARIRGKLRYAAEQPIEVRPGAQVSGGIERLPRTRGAPQAARPFVTPRFWLGVHLVEILALIVLGLVAFGLAPGAAASVTRQVAERFGVSLLIGFVLLVTVPVAAFLLLLTLIAIPLSGIIVLLYVATLLPGQVFVAAWLGDRIVRALTRGRDGRRSIYWTLVIGTVALVLLFAIPYLGWIMRLVATLAGFGALWLSVWTALAARPQAPAQSPPAPA